MTARTRVNLAAAMSLLFTAGRATAGDLNATAGCDPSNRVLVEWSFYETPGNPVNRPEWTGYDVYRRDVAGCSAWTRLNDAVIPRVVGASHGGSWLDAPPAFTTLYEYKVVPVDAAGNAVVMPYPDCEPPCVSHTWASCPALSAPLTVGTIGPDMGWAVVVQPCGDGCWGGFYVAEPGASALRPYAGTGTVLDLFGTEYCGTVEGCGMNLQRFAPDGCGPTAGLRRSWGGLKLRYR